jgi:hypothetical protein
MSAPNMTQPPTMISQPILRRLIVQAMLHAGEQGMPEADIRAMHNEAEQTLLIAQIIQIALDPNVPQVAMGWKDGELLFYTPDKQQAKAFAQYEESYGDEDDT